MSVRTIAFSVQLGTEGLAIGQTVAARLGFRYLDWNDTSKAAIAAGVSPEVIADFERNRPRLLSIVEKLLTSAGMMNDDFTSDATVDPRVMAWAMSSLNQTGYRDFVEDMVREVSAQGRAVIMGHAAQVILRDDESALKVLICGSEEQRAVRLASESGNPIEAALRDVQKADRERRDFYKKVYGVDVFGPELYDLSVNSDGMGRSAAIESILATIHAIGVEDRAQEPASVPERRDAEVRGRETPATSEQDALRRARLGLEAAIGDGTKAPDRAGVIAAIDEVGKVFRLHISEAEDGDGTLADALRKKPYLEPRVRQLKDEHLRIPRDIASLRAEVTGWSPRESFDALREHATRVLVSLRLHEARGFDLLYEAYVREEGGE